LKKKNQNPLLHFFFETQERIKTINVYMREEKNKYSKNSKNGNAHNAQPQKRNIFWFSFLEKQQKKIIIGK
jgi:CRISPR/Cas system-associated protein endoribonuclease Cas2